MWDNSTAAKKERRIDTKKKKKSTTVLDMTLSGICPTLKNPFNQRTHNNMGVDLTRGIICLCPAHPWESSTGLSSEKCHVHVFDA